MISLFEGIMLSLLVLGTLGMTRYLNRIMKKRGFKVNRALNLSLMGVIAILLCIVGGVTAWTLQGIAFALILLYASSQDFTNASGLSLWSMLGGGIIAFVPTLAMTILCKNGFGGADIKIAGASGLMLGFMGGSIGYLIGLLFAVVFNLIYNKVKGRSNEIAFPMLPFLSCGLMLGYFIF